MENRSKSDILLTCEHATNHLPAEYKEFFAGLEDLLASHRGWDPGAYVLAKYMAGEMKAPLFAFPYSRLLIEPNRSPGHPALFSNVSKSFSKQVKSNLIIQHYLPYRKRIENAIKQKIAAGRRVLHLSIHSFAPELHGCVRELEIGILYDPKRQPEKEFARKWKQSLQKIIPACRTRMNRPYKGNSDGLTTALRKQFDEKDYLGIELEMNQKLFTNQIGELPDLLIESLKAVLSFGEE